MSRIKLPSLKFALQLICFLSHVSIKTLNENSIPFKISEADNLRSNKISVNKDFLSFEIETTEFYEVGNYSAQIV